MRGILSAVYLGLSLAATHAGNESMCLWLPRAVLVITIDHHTLLCGPGAHALGNFHELLQGIDCL